MPAPNLIESVGGHAQKPTTFVSLFTSRFFNGYFSNRSLLRGPLGFLYTDFYHAGTTDVLCDGLNSELSTRLTMIRRPGNPEYSTASTDAAIDSFYSFHHADGTIQVIADSTTDVEVFTPSSETTIWTKTTGAGESYFQGINKTLYIGDGIDLVKYIPGTVNPFATSGTPAGQPVWNWGGAAPTVAPTLTITETASAGVAWAASTMFTTMGLLVDANNNIQFLISVHQNGNATQFGLTGNGQPVWNNTPSGTTTDNTITWTCKGQLGLWVAGKTWSVFQPIYDPVSNGIYVAFYGGTSGSVRPTFHPIFNTHTTDSGGVQWQYIGPPALWLPSTTYNSFWEHPMEMICEPILPTIDILNSGSQPVYIQTANDQTIGHNNVPGTSGSGYTPPWQTTPGLTTADGQLLWSCLGPKAWAANTGYAAWTAGSTSFSAIVDGNGNFQVCNVTGASQATTPYNGWQPSRTYGAGAIIAVQNPGSATGFTAFETVAGLTSGASEPSWDYVTGHTTSDNGGTWTSQGATTAGVPVWGLNYGVVTKDGSASWVNVGTAANSTWAAATSWYMPPNGFAIPSGGQPYGGASVIGSAWVQFVTQSGKSGSSAPSWGTSVGATVTDNTITWTAVSAFGAVGFTWTKGYGYVYSFKARGAADTYVTNAPPLQLPNTNSPNIVGPLGPPFGCGDNTITTASPLAFFTGAQTAGAQITISGQGSTDPQFDTVVIFRCADGFQTSGPYLEVTELNMPPLTSGGLPGTWSIIDFMPDTPTATLPGLNELSVAPINHVNDPPPGQFGSLFFSQSSPSTPQVAAAGSGLIGTTYHQGRLWGFIGNNVFASGGPDTTVGNGFTAWPPTYEFPFQSQVIRLVSTTSGLLVYTTTDLYIIAGGPSITTYYSQLLVPGLGLLSWNALALVAGIPHVFTSDRQLLGIQPGAGIIRVGHPIGDQLVNFNPANTYLTYHSYGDMDHALFIGDGISSWYRCDTNLAPDSSYTGPVWSPKTTIAAGFKALMSVETSPGQNQLLIGPASAGLILARDSTFSVFSDGGAPGGAVPPAVIYSAQGSPITMVPSSGIKINDYILVAVSETHGSGGFSSISDSISTSYTSLGSTSATHQSCHLFVGKATANASSLTITINGTNFTLSSPFACAAIIRGASAYTFNTSTISSSPGSSSLSTPAAGCLVFGMAAMLGASISNNNLAILTENGSGVGIAQAGIIANSGTNVTSSWSQASFSPNGLIAVVAFEPTMPPFGSGGSPYESYFTMGNIVLATAGQMAQMAFFEMDFQQVGTQPTVQILFDELSATNGAAFETISNSFVSDPPKLYGPTATPATMWMNRYYFGQSTPGNSGNTPSPAWCKHLQCKVDFGNTDTVQNELLAFTIFGALWQER